MVEQASLPALRASLTEAASILRICRAMLYRRIKAGEIRVQHDGVRAFISVTELKRYVASLESSAPPTPAPPRAPRPGRRPRAAVA